MSGVKNLEILLKEMKPILEEIDYVFCTKKVFTITENILLLSPIGTFLEKEGMTIILEKEKADKAGLSYDGVFNKISLEVHSSLEAVGLTASISNALKEKEISANVVAGFYHNHIFIPKDKSLIALNTLLEFSK